jgi:6-phosphogluconolactonase
MIGSPAAAGSGSRSMTIDAKGKFLYVANETSGDVSAFTLNPASGTPSSSGAALKADSRSFGVAVDPAGHFAYVANFGADNISIYSIEPSSGALTATGVRRDRAGRLSVVTS